ANPPGPELPPPLHAHSASIDLGPFRLQVLLEEEPLPEAGAALGSGQDPFPSCRSQVPQIGHYPLAGPSPRSMGLDQLPVDVLPGSLRAAATPEIHTAMIADPERQQVYTTSGFAVGSCSRRSRSPRPPCGEKTLALDFQPLTAELGLAGLFAPTAIQTRFVIP